MADKLQDLLKASSGGFARTNQFKVIFSLPPVALADASFATFGGGGDLNGKLTLLCETVTIPTIEVGQIDIPMAGQRLPLPGDRVFNDLVASFRVDKNVNVYTALLRWQAAIASLDGACGSADFENIQSDIVVLQYHKDGCDERSVAKWVFKSTFLKSLGEINYDMKSENEIVTVQATFPITTMDYFAIPQNLR